MTSTDRDRDILALNQAVLDCVVNGDWQGYAGYCCCSLSCFEAETEGVMVEGLPFHRFYFPQSVAPSTASASHPVSVTMSRPHLRWLSDEAVVISYTRLVQRLLDGVYSTARCCETRIWQKLDGQWKQVHVHRS